MALAMKVILAPNIGTHLLPTTRAAEKGMFTQFETESWLIANGRKVRLRKSPDQYKVYLDGIIARMPTNYPILEVQKLDKREVHGSARVASTATVWHRRLGHPHSGVIDEAKTIEGAGVEFTGNAEPCETFPTNKSKRLTHPKETEYNVTQPLQLIYTDILGPIYPRSPRNFRYIHKFSD